ncbi:MAG: hypothetical protein NZM31_15340 [Gemmatales bacterium]|nr:hypothetical protein [Gemmatales bacterium]MDW8388370.1 hypothetical protein [Gemmatales bacterium]
MSRILCVLLLVGLLCGGIGCSGQATVEGKVDVESPQQYQRKDRHVYKPQTAKPKPPEQ